MTRTVGRLVIASAATMAGIALFERFAPPRVVRWYMRSLGNPMFRTFCGIAPGWAVLEVTGRRSGRTHRVNVGCRRIGDAYWMHARRDSQYVKNLAAHPRVRLRTMGRWRDVVAQVRPERDVSVVRVNPVNAAFLGLAGPALVTVRLS